MTCRFALAILSGGILAGAGCGGGEEIDPRCEALCIVQEPSLAGAYDMCSAESASLCERECSARIADVSSLCATCLLEGATFGDDDDAWVEDCADGSCTIYGREGNCTYPIGDDNARDDCIRQVFPRRTVECSTSYRPVSECSSSCGG